ncbi:MAG: hypothetical protein ABJD97_01550 [Betaproteobacteria bacterium]
MAVFESWPRDEQARWLMAPEAGWGNGPNCHAFAKTVGGGFVFAGYVIVPDDGIVVSGFTGAYRDA